MTNITSGDSKDNPMMISDKSPIKDENDWWIKTQLRESDHCLLSSQFSELQGFQNTILAHHLKFQPVSNGALSIQILHAGT